MAFRSQFVSKPSDPHTINVTVVQSGNADYFSIVEETTWNQGTWSKADDSNRTLTMKGTDVSGMLRFKSSVPSDQHEEFFLVALGVDGSGPEKWCDLKVDLKDTDTGALIHQKYYNIDNDECSKKDDHKASVSLTSAKKTDITVQYYTDDKKLKGHGKKLRGVVITIT
jgi:hypothetical protein